MYVEVGSAPSELELITSGATVVVTASVSNRLVANRLVAPIYSPVVSDITSKGSALKDAASDSIVV